MIPSFCEKYRGQYVKSLVFSNVLSGSSIKHNFEHFDGSTRQAIRLSLGRYHIYNIFDHNHSRYRFGDKPYCFVQKWRPSSEGHPYDGGGVNFRRFFMGHVPHWSKVFIHRVGTISRNSRLYGRSPLSAHEFLIAATRHGGIWVRQGFNIGSDG